MIQKVFFKLKERFVGMGLYNIITLSLTICMLIAILVLGIVLHIGKNALPDQLMAGRWSKEGDVAQVSCFYSKEAYVTEDSIGQMRYNLERKMQEQALVPNTDTARLYIDAYSAEGNITIQSDKKSIEANVIGIGGDFFLFHPVELLSGMYFSGNDLMQDSVLLDEEAAWQLFGSNDIAGKTVTIYGMPYRVAGVYSREQGDLETMAGSKDTTIYMSYSALASLNGCNITCYEVVMPNPVEGFALDNISEVNVSSEENVKMVENSNRFSYISLYNIWTERASRSMKTDDIVFPFWENLARVKEESLMEVALWQIFMICILAIYWSVRLMIFIIKHKPNAQTFVKIWEYCIEKLRLWHKKAKEKKAARKEKELNTYIEF